MTLHAVYYSAELDVCVIVHPKAFDSESWEIVTPAEWNSLDMYKAQMLYGFESDLFERGNFEYIGEL